MNVKEELTSGSSASIGGGDVVALNSLHVRDHSTILCDLNHPIDAILKMLRW